MTKKEYFNELWGPGNYEAFLQCMIVTSK